MTDTASTRRARLDALREASLHREVHAHDGSGFNGRWSRRQWAHASLFAMAAMLAAAIVPGFDRPLPARTGASVATRSMALALPRLHLSHAHGDSWQTVTVKHGQTLASIMQGLGIPAATREQLQRQSLVRDHLRQLAVGSVIAFDLPVDGELRALRFDIDDTHRAELKLANGAITPAVDVVPTETRSVVISGKVGDSLFRSARKLGLSQEDIATLTDDMFKYDIDFNNDVGADDRFSVVVEQTWREGELLHTGPVRAATFSVGDTLYSAFRFDRNGKPEYFTADGRSLKRSFIRMPIPYARLSSGFGNRFHPVLGRMRMHKGVDYAAGTGTPIMAAGDARVAFVGWKGGYGRVVELDHGRGYSTLYGHMSAFGREHVGQRVEQGAVIGYVGASGLATGPHLHYEFKVNGMQRNPLSVTMPPPEPLSGGALAAFRSQTRTALTRIREVEHVIYSGDDEPVVRVAKVEGRTGHTRS